MADTADLVVLGAFYGQGSKGRSGAGLRQRCVCSGNSQGFPVPGWLEQGLRAAAHHMLAVGLLWAVGTAELQVLGWAVAQCRGSVQLCEWS